MLLARIRDAAQTANASALHVLGSVARSTADEHSDLDVWLTFPDAAIASVLQNRHAVFASVGDILISHEAASNSPVDGAYALVVYQTSAGPMQVDWYLAPQSTSRVAPDALTKFEDWPVEQGEWRLDRSAQRDQTLRERVDWLVCMLFIGVKKVLRGRDRDFESFLARAYLEVGQQYGLVDLPPATPDSLRAIRGMLRPLSRYADTSQRRAISSVDTYISRSSG
jgi:hypothetical protein